MGQSYETDENGNVILSFAHIYHSEGYLQQRKESTKKMIEENQDMKEDLESPEKLFRERKEKFWEQMEDWFGDFNKDPGIINTLI